MDMEQVGHNGSFLEKGRKPLFNHRNPQAPTPVTQYYSFPPMEDQHYPNQQVPPGESTAT